jgi:hypothetical protein
MYGENSGKGGNRLYYGCSNRRKRLSRTLVERSAAKWIAAEALETALRDELRQCLPSGDLDGAMRDRLRKALEKTPSQQKVTEAALRRIDEQLGRVK